MLLLLGFFCLCLILWRSKSSKNQSMEPPDLPGKLPLIGHGHRFLGNSVELFQTIKQIIETCLEVGSSFKIYMGPRVFYAVADPEDCLTIANACLQKHYIYDFAKPLLANGLLNADVTTWKIHRKLLNPAFSQHVLDGFIDVFNTQAQILVDQFANEVGKPLSHEHILRCNNLETICSTATGVDRDEYGHIQKKYLPRLEEVFAIFNKRVQKFWLHNDYIYNMTSLKKKQDESINCLVELSKTIIQKKKSEMNDQAVRDKPLNKFKPFMELMLELTKEIDSFTDEQIRGETDTIIAAGHDTDASALTFCLTLLGSNVHVQEKAYEEITQVLGNSTNVDKEALTKLVYIEAILKESLRLYPSVPVIIRQLDKDVKLKNHTLKANTGCFLFIYGVNRHKMWGPDANTFRPERWLEKESLPNSKYYAAFGLGRRSCIGKAFAMMSMKIKLAKVLRQYRISSDISKIVLKVELVMKPASGHLISLEPRNV